jgi:hypothetical protein
MRARTAAALALALVAPAAAAQDAPPAYGWRTLGLRGMGADVGLILPARTEAASVVTRRGDLGLLGPDVRIIPSMSYWSSRVQPDEVETLERRLEEVCARQGAPCDDLELGEVLLTDLSLSLEARVSLRRAGPLEPYAGLGLGVHLLNGQSDFLDGTFVEDLLDAITPGTHLTVGMELPLHRRLRVYGEGRAVLASDTRYVGVALGGSVLLPTQAADPPPSPPGPTDPPLDGTP